MSNISLKLCLFTFILGTLYPIHGNSASTNPSFESTLKSFSSYKVGEAQKIVHETRLACFLNTHDPSLRQHNEKLLLTFLESEASVDARREACLWLGKLGSTSSLAVLEKLKPHADFTDVVTMALGDITQRQISLEKMNHQLAIFKREVLASEKKSELLKTAIQGPDDDIARLAFELIEASGTTNEMFPWLLEQAPKLNMGRQIISLNQVFKSGHPIKSKFIRQLSREAQSEAKQYALPLLGFIANSEDTQLLNSIYLKGNRTESSAAYQGLLTVPENLLLGIVQQQSSSSDLKIQDATIALIKSRGLTTENATLWKVAKDESNPNSKSAIRALGITALESEYPAMLEMWMMNNGKPSQNEWQSAVWDMSRRMPNYESALTILSQAKDKVPDNLTAAITSLSDKLRKMTTKAEY